MIRPRGKSSSAPAQPKINIIIDSGAFSAWRSGKPIKLDQYCDYLLANLDWITSYVALDVIIPGDPERAAQESFDNFLYMRKRGLEPIPVFHVGEDISWLHRMLDQKCEYIGLSASSLVSRNQVDDWYSYAWSHIVNSDGLPVVKAHAFGEGRVESLKQFPWYSADSTSWIYTAQRTGTVDLPGGGKLGMRNDGASVKSAQDIGGLSPLEAAAWEAVLRTAGVASEAFAERGQDATLLRTYITALCYLQNEAAVRALHPIQHHARGFLHQGCAAADPVKFDAFNMHLVCGTNNMAYALLAKLKHPSILASYFYITDPVSHTRKGSDTSKGYTFKFLREFMTDPIGFVSTTDPWKKHWDILEKYIHD